jgi:hypothetical protein
MYYFCGGCGYLISMDLKTFDLQMVSGQVGDESNGFREVASYMIYKICSLEMSGMNHFG